MIPLPTPISKTLGDFLSFKISNIVFNSSRNQIFITEGAVDSLFLDNAIAVNGADLTRVLQLLSNMNVVFIPDNEPRNPQILEFYSKIINLGVQIVIFPKHIVGKDINLMILNHGRDYILETIRNNIYQGIQAKLKFISWKRR